MGWQREDVKLVQQMASNGAEPIGSLGYDGPLAALSPERQNLADYFKETVAVVTNQAGIARTVGPRIHRADQSLLFPHFAIKP